MSNIRDSFDELVELEFNDHYYGTYSIRELPDSEIDEEYESYCYQMDMLAEQEQNDNVNWWVS